MRKLYWLFVSWKFRAKSFIARVQWAVRVGEIAYRQDNNKAVETIVKAYKCHKQSPIAHHMDIYWQWMRNAESVDTQFVNGNIYITFYNES